MLVTFILVADISSFCFSTSRTIAFLPLLVSAVAPDDDEFLPSLGVTVDKDLRATSRSKPSRSISVFFVLLDIVVVCSLVDVVWPFDIVLSLVVSVVLSLLDFFVVVRLVVVILLLV